jgi:hypothetical protein
MDSQGGTVLDTLNQEFLNELRAFLDSLPSDEKPQFTKKITDYVATAPVQVEEVLLHILESEQNTQIRFAAFYTLVVYYRRYKLSGRLEQLANRYGSNFNDRPLYLFTMSTMYRNKGGKNNLAIALQYAEEAIKKTVDYPGYFNNYAEIVADALEDGMEFTNQEEVIANAFRYINKAIMINSNYAKYYCTLGRLQYCTGEYQAGKLNILKAIDLEDNNQKDYAIRIADYQYFLLKCHSVESVKKLKEIIDEKTLEIHNIKDQLHRNVQEEKTKIIEFLGFFTAIISFIVSTVQIVSKVELSQAPVLILVMLGGLLIAFGAFKTIITMDRKSVMVAVTFAVLGSAIIALSLMLKSQL